MSQQAAWANTQQQQQNSQPPSPSMLDDPTMLAAFHNLTNANELLKQMTATAAVSTRNTSGCISFILAGICNANIDAANCLACKNCDLKVQQRRHGSTACKQSTTSFSKIQDWMQFDLDHLGNIKSRTARLQTIFLVKRLMVLVSKIRKFKYDNLIETGFLVCCGIAQSKEEQQQLLANNNATTPMFNYATNPPPIHEFVMLELELPHYDTALMTPNSVVWQYDKTFKFLESQTRKVLQFKQSLWSIKKFKTVTILLF